MNRNDISVDLETLGTAFDAPVISIGAVAFDRTTGKLGQQFYKEVELNSAIKSGRVSASTLSWWINQSPRAKAIFTSKPDQPSLATALLDFTTWCRATGNGVPRMWANGPAQDITWLEHAITVGSHGLSPAWHHSNVSDVRTIKLLALEIAGFDANGEVEPVGEAHNALDDAVYQANVISACYAALRRSGKGGDAAKAAQPKRKSVDDDEL